MEKNEARERLIKEKERVEGLMSDLRDDLGASNDASELSSYDQHPADQGTETFERERDIGLLDELEAELGEIEAALVRIEDGTYGIDEVTGEPIPEERLQAVPTARRNV